MKLLTYAKIHAENVETFSACILRYTFSGGDILSATPQIVPITDLRKAHLEVLDMLDQGPVFLAQRSRAAAVLLSTDQWDKLNARLEDYAALVDYLEVKLQLATGETELEDVTLDELKDEAYAVPAEI
ncbi:MAG: hypothetical protein R2932_17795 [Caldilineaceae bacterium]